ncbi:MAG TPA: HAMP domain-containing sensor histidine kinase [Candidatus Limnocylindria bacterium]|nr:HAMP domain-containing sensor histidine kinase [Candidatus Limnocylindria bacterium]
MKGGELVGPTWRGGAARVAAGAAIGALAGAISVWLGFGTLSGVLPLIAVVAVGLLLGWMAAGAAYAAAIVAALGLLALREPVALAAADLLRLGLALVGGPLLIALIRRDQRSTESMWAARNELEALAREGRRREDELRATQEELALAYARAEQERARLTEVADAIPEPLIVFDGEGRGRYGNMAAMRLFGRAFVERPVDEWQRLADPRDERGVPLAAGSLPQLLAQTAPLRTRMVVRLPTSGRDLLVDVEGTPVPGGGCVVLLRDVGKEEDERRRLSRFASFVAHELRNPLAVAKARVELAQRDAQLSPRSRSHGVRALDSIEAAIAILERLELYSRADSGRVEARREPFNLGAAVETAVERLRARGSERELRIRMPAQTMVIGDRQLAEGAITNLLTNADRYSTPDGAIRVEATNGDPVVLRVADDGPGIADDVAERIFRDRISSGRGLGLGLFLVHASMDAMGGSVELERRRPKAVFALRFPAAPRGARAGTAPE